MLCLQEVDRGQARSEGVDQVEVIATRMGAHSRRFEPALVGEPGGHWRAAADRDATGADDRRAGRDEADGDDGKGADEVGPEPGYGVGLVSRLPVQAWHVIRLAAAPVRSPVAVPGGRGRFILLPDEPRVVLAAEIEGPYGLMVIATTHLSFVPGWNLVQLRRAARALAALAAGRPCMLVGDLNFPGPLPVVAARGWRRLGSPIRTYPAQRPRLQVDHALGHGRVPNVAAVSAPELTLSDHRALVLDFDG